MLAPKTFLPSSNQAVPESEPPFPRERVEAIARALVPYVEQAVGHVYESFPCIQWADSQAIISILQEEEDDNREWVLLGQYPEDVATIKAALLDSAVKHPLALYSHKRNTIMVSLRSFRDHCARGRQSFSKEDLLRVILVHELVHALDEQVYGLSQKINQATTLLQVAVLRILQEGHAEYITHKFAQTQEGRGMRAALGEQADVLRNEMRARGPYEEEYLDKRLPKSVLNMHRFKREAGRTFFKALEDSRIEHAMDSAFDEPPSSTAEIAHPVKFLLQHKMFTPLGDLTPTWRHLFERHVTESPGVLRPHKVAVITELTEDHIRLMYISLGARELDGALDEWESGQLLAIATPIDKPSNPMWHRNGILFCVHQFRTHEGAQRFLEMNDTIYGNLGQLQEEGELNSLQTAEFITPGGAKGKVETFRWSKDLVDGRWRSYGVLHSRYAILAYITNDPIGDVEVGSYIDTIREALGAGDGDGPTPSCGGDEPAGQETPRSEER